MEMFTNEPGVQVYSGNFQGVGKDADIIRKHGVKYPKHVSVCLESQKYPDSPNHPEWASPVLNPGGKYFSHAAYKFSVKYLAAPRLMIQGIQDIEIINIDYSNNQNN